MSPVDRSDIPPSVREVLAYFLNHPGAAGSLRDLAESRIAQEIAFHNIRQVTAAVEWLLERRFLVHKFDPILTLNTDMTGDAEQLVADLAPPQASPERPGPRPVEVLPLGKDRPAVEELESEQPAAALPIASVPASDALGAACLEWINATLLRYYRKNRFTKDDHPGLSRDAATIERLLAPRVTPELEGETPLATPEADERALTQAIAEADGRDRLVVLKQIGRAHV